MLCIAVMVRGNHLLLRERDADCTEWGEGFHLSFWGDVYWDLLRLLQLRTAVTQVLESLHVGSVGQFPAPPVPTCAITSFHMDKGICQK